jgi:hypothetical protein
MTLMIFSVLGRSSPVGFGFGPCFALVFGSFIRKVERVTPAGRKTSAGERGKL